MIDVVIVGGGTGDTYDYMDKRNINVVETISIGECKFKERANISLTSLDELEKELDKINFRIGVLLGVKHIIPKSITDKYIFINLHPSMLPHYKGLDPIEKMIKNNDYKYSGITLHLVDDKIDNGEIILRTHVKFTTLDKTYEHCRIAGVTLINMFFESLNFYQNKIYLLGESGVGKSFILDKLKRIGVETHNTPWNDIKDIENLSVLQEEFLYRILDQLVEGRGVFEGDPVSTLAFSMIAYRKGLIYNIDNIFVIWYRILDQMRKDNCKYVYINRPSSLTRLQRIIRDREFEYSKDMSERDTSDMNRDIVTTSLSILDEIEVDLTQWNLLNVTLEELVLRGYYESNNN